MYITPREREIINLLLSQPDGITVSEIAQKMALSERTIHRELKNVSFTLTKHEIELEKIPGVGLFLQGENEQRNELKINLLKQVTDFTSKEREELILLTLLKSTDAIKLVTLATDFNVTVRTISQDLEQIAVYLKSFGITLTRKKGHGISLEATEQQKRNALGYFLSMQFNEYEFLEILKDSAENKNKFLEIIKIEKLILAEKLVREMVKQHDMQLTDHAHMTLTIHLSLAIERIIQGEMITIDKVLLNELKNDEKYSLSQNIGNAIENVFKIEVPDAELGYITIHLKGARLNASILNRINEKNDRYVSACKTLIAYVSQKLEVPFERDTTILEGLLKHIEPAVYRLERGLDLYNPLTSKIIAEYPMIFEATKEGLKKCFDNIHFSDSEVAYVVLYFGASHVLYDAKREVKVVIICPSGLGSSKMLSSRIEKEITSISEIKVLSLKDLELIDLSDFDLVLSTVEIEMNSIEYLLISPILSDAEIERIKKEIHHDKRTTEAALLERVHQQQTQFDITEAFQKIKVYSELVLKLVDEFVLYQLIVDEDETVTKMLQVLQHNQMITDVSEVQKDLAKRELLGGFGIPDTQIAFCHCRTTAVDKTIFCVFRLSQSINMSAMDKNTIGVVTILVVLAPVDLLEIELEVLSLIATFLIEDTAMTQLFTIGSESAIKERLMYLFYQKFKTMFKK